MAQVVDVSQELDQLIITGSLCMRGFCMIVLSDNSTSPLTTTTLTHPDPGIVRDDRGTSSTQRKDPNALQRWPSEEID
ncbi:MAG: hypothetical protein ACI87O_001426 [Planctomycetota bacterium]|jgi:hypothetical protein